MNLDGEVARVSTAIKPNEEGEVIVPLQGGSQAFPARSYDPKAEFAAGERVVVLEQAGRVLYVSAGT